MFKNLFNKLFGKKTKPANENGENEREVIHTIEMKSVEDILVLLQKDHYREGYLAALKVPDRELGNTKLESIKSRYLTYIQMVENRYEKVKNELLKQQKLNTDMNMNDLALDNQKSIDELNKKIEVLKKIREDVVSRAEDGYFQYVEKTFWTGFLTGIQDALTGHRIMTGTEIRPMPFANNENHTNNTK